MDITISRLNNRVALQVPAELPLGLVFIVGRVARLQRSHDGEVVLFDLVEGRHRLPCRLPGRVAQETLLEEGDRVRAGGRLLFNPRLAGYVLVTRDVAVLPKRSPETSLQPFVDDARARARQTSLAQDDLPPWVARLAPPEVRRELGLQPPPETAPGADGNAPNVDAFADIVPETPAERALPSEMVTFLSQAIDSDDDIELTAEMISDYVPGSASSDPASERDREPGQHEAAPAPEKPRVAPGEAAPAWQTRLPRLAALLLALLLLAAVLLFILTQV